MSKNPKYPAAAIPYLMVRGAADALDFYKKAFGAEETMRFPMPNGLIGHAEIRIEGARRMVGILERGLWSRIRGANLGHAGEMRSLGNSRRAVAPRQELARWSPPCVRDLEAEKRLPVPVRRRMMPE